MCDICPIKCEECDRVLVVHIGDFSTDEENVAVRCCKHKPPVDTPLKWKAFSKCEWGYTDSWRTHGKSTWYMACRDMEAVDDGYGVGEDGDIVPNCDWDSEEDWNP